MDMTVNKVQMARRNSKIRTLATDSDSQPSIKIAPVPNSDSAPMISKQNKVAQWRRADSFKISPFPTV